MGQRPQLPDSDDPSQVLGLSDQPTLSEVYLARRTLIRSFQPNRAPREYQRIQAAFEYWRDVLSLPEFGRPHQPTGAERFARPVVAQVWPEPAPDRVGPHVAEFLARQRAGATAQALAHWWLSGLRDGLELVESIFYYSPPEVLEQLAQSDELAWPTLGQRRIRWRGRLWQVYAVSRLERGDSALLLDQIRGLDFRLAAKGDQALRDAAWQALSVAAWGMPEQAFDELAWLEALDPKSTGARTFLEIRALRGQLQRRTSSPTVPASFGPLVRFSRVSVRARSRSLHDIANAWSRQEESWWQLCKALAQHSPALTRYLLAGLRLDEWTYEPNVDQLSAARQRSLEEVLQSAKRSQGSLASRAAIALFTILGAILLVSVIAWLVFAALSAVGRQPRGSDWLPRWVLAITLGSAGVAGAVEKSQRDRAPLRFLRRELLRLGFGYQQLLSARSWVRDPLPKDLGRHPGLELYLTLGLSAAHVLAAERAQ